MEFFNIRSKTMRKTAYKYINSDIIVYLNKPMDLTLDIYENILNQINLENDIHIKFYENTFNLVKTKSNNNLSMSNLIDLISYLLDNNLKHCHIYHLDNHILTIINRGYNVNL